jgi:hypothetical protein
VYKSNEPMGANALYVMVIDPAVKAAEYDLFVLLAETLGKDYGTEANQALAKNAAGAFASGVNRLNLTPLNLGGM